jgi:ZIP family zinc transporter
MTGGEGFAKVMPAAFFPWCLIYFGIDKVLHLHINFKISEGIKSPWQRTTLLVRQLHCITFRRIGCWSSFGGVAAGTRSFYCWGCNIGYRNSEFSEGIAVSMPAKNGNEQMEKFYVWAIFRIGRAYCSCFRGFCSYIFTPILPYALALRQVP